MIERFGDDIPKDEIAYKRRKAVEKVEKRRKEAKKYRATTEELIELSESDDEVDSDDSDDKIILRRSGRALKLTAKKCNLIGLSAAGEGRK